MSADVKDKSEDLEATVGRGFKVQGRVAGVLFQVFGGVLKVLMPGSRKSPCRTSTDSRGRCTMILLLQVLGVLYSKLTKGGGGIWLQKGATINHALFL